MGNGVGMADGKYGFLYCTVGVEAGSAGAGATGAQPLNIMIVINNKLARANFDMVMCPFNTTDARHT
jgi:hypothetical protein